MIGAAERVLGYVHGLSYEDFVADTKTHDAVVMNLIVLAEAAKGVPDDVKARSPNTKWRAIEGFRNRAAHSGMTMDLALDLSVVWQICSAELAVLIPELRILLQE